MSDSEPRATHVVAPNHRIGLDHARRHGVPTRNIIVRSESLRGMGSNAHLIVVHGPLGLRREIHQELEILRHKGATVRSADGSS